MDGLESFIFTSAHGARMFSQGELFLWLRHNPAALEFAVRHATRTELRARRSFDNWADWLSTGEHETYASLVDPRRREAWLLGRLYAKRLILQCLATHETPTVGSRITEEVSPVEIHVDSRDGLGRSVQPRVTVRGRLQSWSLSIAHSEHSVVVAFSGRPDVSVGVDVVPFKALGENFLAIWLTRAEREWLRRSGTPKLASTVWALKEAVFKSVNVGEPFVPRQIEIFPNLPGTYSCRVRQQVRGDLQMGITAVDHEIVAVVSSRKAILAANCSNTARAESNRRSGTRLTKTARAKTYLLSVVGSSAKLV